MPVRTVLVGSSASEGGAARAQYRVFRALRAHVPRDVLEVTLRVVGHTPEAEDLTAGVVSGLPQGLSRFRRQASYRIDRMREIQPSVSASKSFRSTARIWTGLGRELQHGPYDIVMLGWTGSGTISIEEIGRLSKPVVWRMDDMWPFCGAEHTTEGSRYRDGYTRSNRPDGDSGRDRDRETWERKRKAWRIQQHVVTPSRWLADRVRESELMRGWPVRVIPHPLDLDFWAPGPRDSDADGMVGVDPARPVLLFAAEGATSTPNKGFDLLASALTLLSARLDASPAVRPQVAIVGNSRPSLTDCAGFPVIDVGRIRDDLRMRALYRAADIVVVPSRVESFGQVAVEAQACGKPVVAFRTGGLSDIVVDGQTGLLAEPFIAEQLCTAMERLVRNESVRLQFGAAARKRMEALVSPPRVAAQYLTLLQEIAAERAR
jgi:glycosyltransferase involved in cell wall biosynthesis